MSAVEELTRICATLPAHKVEQLVDFALFLRTRAEPVIKEDAEAEAAWERIIADPKPRPKLEAFMKASFAKRPSELLTDEALAKHLKLSAGKILPPSS